MSGIQVGDTEWTTAELAERGVPCVCGHHPDDHRALEDDETYIDALTAGWCPHYCPDIEALCPDCDGTGGYTSHGACSRWEDAEYDCAGCDGTGIRRQSRWVA